MKTLESERLILRNWKMSDLDDLHQFASNKKVADLAGFKIKNNKEDSLKTLQSFIANSNDSLCGVGLKELDKLVVWAIELKELNKVVGWIELCKATCEPSEETFKYSKEIGFTLAEEHWGKGLMPEAILRIIKYLLNEEEIDAVVCSHFINNNQSEKAIKKCGFKFYLADDNEKYYCLTKDAPDKIK